MADGSEDSDGSDEWGMEEVVIPPSADAAKRSKHGDQADPKGEDEDYWKVEPKAKEALPEKEHVQEESKPSEPMIIVDMTQMDAKIHSKYDKNSVSDSAAASALRKKIESDYATYSKDGSLLSEGTVIPCGSSVWRDALVRLRDERPGHYFAPIFPPQR